MISARLAASGRTAVLRRISLLALDSDGVLTDGGMYYSARGEEFKKFNTRDGHGIGLLHQAGLRTAIISGENSAAVAARARKLHITEVRLGVKDKLSALRDLAARLRIPLAKIAYIGDDLNDLDVLRAVGFSACPGDAVDEVRAVVDHVCRKNGGAGAVRELCDLILGPRD